MSENTVHITRLAEAQTKRAGNSPRPVIRLIAGRLSEIATEAERALIAGGIPIYRRGPVLVRPVVEEMEATRGRKTYIAQLARVEAAYLRDVLGRVAEWKKFNVRKGDWVAADPSQDIAATILARYGEWAFHPVLGVITTQTLRPDGTLLNEPGYDPATRLILMSPPALPDIAPTRENAEAALRLLSELLSEFPFVDAASRSVALSALITPIVRAAFPVAPAHIMRAPSAGSGKSYLLDVAATMATGQPMPVTAAGRTEEESEKRLGAALLAGQPLISLDNLNGELAGDFLCQAIERPVLEVRILGRSERVRIEARGTTFFATGNNITLRGDVTRRGLVGSLDSECERPERRQFRDDPVARVLADRGRYVAAALCIVRAYIAAGQPNKAPRLASFGEWSDTVRSALIWLGAPDPVDTMEVAREEDPERLLLVGVMSSWAEALGTGWENRRTLADLLKTVDERDTIYGGSGDHHEGYERPYRYPALRDAVMATAPRGRLDAKAFGYWLRRFKGRLEAGLRIASQSDVHGAEWWIERKASPTPRP